MKLYHQIQQAEQQLNDLIDHLSHFTNHHGALLRAKACLTEGIEHMVYAAREQIAREGTLLECRECGRRFPPHHGAYGCPEGHTEGVNQINPQD